MALHLQSIAGLLPDTVASVIRQMQKHHLDSEACQTCAMVQAPSVFLCMTTVTRAHTGMRLYCRRQDRNWTTPHGVLLL